MAKAKAQAQAKVDVEPDVIRLPVAGEGVIDLNRYRLAYSPRLRFYLEGTMPDLGMIWWDKGKLAWEIVRGKSSRFLSAEDSKQIVLRILDLLKEEVESIRAFDRSGLEIV